MSLSMQLLYFKLFYHFEPFSSYVIIKKRYLEHPFSNPGGSEASALLWSRKICRARLAF